MRENTTTTTTATATHDGSYPWLSFVSISCFVLACIGGLPKQVSSDCLPKGGCTALAYIVATENDTLTSVVALFNSSSTSTQWYSNLSSSGNVTAGKVLLIPFLCQCMVNNQLGQIFQYTVVQGDTGLTIAQNKYRFLTNYDSMITANPTQDLGVLYPQNILNIPVNCSCGNPAVSSQYGLFASYVTQAYDNLLSLSTKFNLSATFLQGYNDGKNINSLIPNIDVLFIPMKDGNGTYPPFNTSALGGGGVSTGTIVGATVGGVIALLLILLAVFFYAHKMRRKAKIQEPKKEHSVNAVDSQGSRLMSGSRESEASNLSLGSTSMANLAMEKSILFTYEELAQATDNFNLTKEIGRGGFGAVYYGEINGQRLAIKKMDIQATREFYAELKVLTNVHHTNLVRLIGYCAEHESLFVVYEYVDNGNLSQHLKPSKSEGRPPLSWAARVQIALDSARGLEYIHEHTTPTYIHRDIKSANILIDKNFRAKVADFGLTKLRETGVGTSSTLPSRLVGTFGYMAPEYARFGDMSVKADVYSFGVVLFEIISAKNAILNNMDSSSSSQGIVGLFEPVLNDLKGEERMKALIDPALGDDYPPEAVWKMAQLAGACTKTDPKLRPNMRSVVVALMTLSSTSISISWLGGPFSQDHSVSALMSGQ